MTFLVYGFQPFEERASIAVVGRERDQDRVGHRFIVAQKQDDGTEAQVGIPALQDFLD